MLDAIQVFEFVLQALGRVLGERLLGATKALEVVDVPFFLLGHLVMEGLTAG